MIQIKAATVAVQKIVFASVAGEKERYGNPLIACNLGLVTMGSSKPKSLRAIPSASGGIARLACVRLREAGKNVSAVLSEAGLTVKEANDPTTRVEARAQIKFLELAAQELKDELFGFHLACNYDLREIGLVYYVIASSQQLADGLRNCERYSMINNEGVRVHFSLAETAAIALNYVNIDRWSDRHHVEFWLVTLMRICRQVTDSRIAADQLKVRHVRADPSAEFKSFFGTAVEFGANVDEISFPARFAHLPIVTRDAHLNGLLQRYAEEALAGRPGARKSFRSEVEATVAQLLPHGRASVSEIAGRLGMSSRALSRKLGKEGMTFWEIVDGLKMTLAKRYLCEGELQISEIAWLLGYQEISSFTHAFRRWSGTTPSRFRSSDRVRGAKKEGLSVSK